MATSHVAVYVGENRVLLRAANRFKYFVDSRDVSIAPHLIIDGVWEEWVEKTIRRVVSPGMHVIEVGANVGYYTVLFAHLVGTGGSVSAFEADPTLAVFVRDNVEINGFPSIVRVENVAVGDRTGEATFYTRDRHRGSGSLVELEQTPWNASDTRTEITVPATTLDAYIAERRVRPDFIKIDAEGGESAILRGAAGLFASAHPLHVVLEFFPEFVRAAGDDPAAFLVRLRDAGFTVRLIDERTRKPVEVTHEALLGRTSSELLFSR